MKKILVTGGTGYIGSHTVVELISQGFEPLIIDNLWNSNIQVVDRIEQITGRRPLFEKVEMCNKEELQNVFRRHPDIAAVIHFAAVLLVNESVEKPLFYYENNLLSTINLLGCMQQFDVNHIVFSSSCTVYGNPDTLPVTENAPVKPAASPYGNTKKIGEDIIRDFTTVSEVKCISLRYFNPIGAHDSALIGEFQHGVPHHLVPYITETAIGKRQVLNVFGGDYNTRDGSCVRDYIHVVDLAKAHILAIQRLINSASADSYEVFNLGSGDGFTVFEMIRSFEKVTGLKINYNVAPRRAGDVEAVYADNSKANTVLGWKPGLTLDDMLSSAWRWEQLLAASGHSA